MSNEVGKVTYRVVADLDQYNKDIKSTESTAQTASLAIAAAFTAAAVKVGQAITGIVKAGINYNMEMERYQTSFETMLGSTEAALSKVEELRKMAAATPFELSDLASATQVLLSFGIASDDASKYLQVLGDISQGNKDKLASLTLAFAQMSSTGKLMGQDLLQMINAGFNPLQIISEKTGKSMAVLKDEMAKGAISADMVAEAFEDATKEGGLFYNAMEKQSKTLSGQMSTLSDNTNEFLGSLTSGLSEIAKTQILPKLNAALGDLTKSAQSGKLRESLDKLYASIGKLADKAIDFAIDAIPKIVDGFSWLADNFDTIIAYAKSLLEVFLAYKAISGVTSVISSVKKGFEGISGIIKTLQPSFAQLGGQINTMAAINMPNLTAALGSVGLSLSSVLGGLTAVGAGIALVVIGIQNSYAEVIAFEKSVDDLQKTTNALSESTQKSSKSFDSQIASINAQSTAALQLLSKLERLDKVENKSADQRKEIKSIVAQLNSLVPDLALAYDEEADALNRTTESILDYIVASKEKAVLAAYEERYTELAEERIQIEDALAEATKERAEAEAELEEKQAALNSAQAANGQTVTSLKGEYETYKQGLEELDAVIAEQEALLQQNTEAQNAVDESVQRTVGSTNEYAGALTGAAGAQEQIILGNYDVTEALAGTGISADEAAAKYQNYADIAQNAFERVQSSINLTAEQLISNLEYNQEALASWAENIAYLAEAGLDEGLLAVLQEAGIEAAGTVENLVLLVEEGGSLERLNAVFQNGSRAAVDSLLKELGLPKVVNSGSDTVTKIADGIETNNDAVEATETAIIAVKGAAVSTIEESDFESVGKMITSGIASGIAAGRSAVINAAVSAARAALQAAKDALDINSPSKVAEDLIGRNFALGIAKGIETEEDKPALQARNLAKELVTESIGGFYPDFTSMLSPSYHISAAPAQAYTFNLVGDVQVDGFTLGQIVLRNLDDVSSMTLRG